MSKRPSFNELMQARFAAGFFACVGLDSDDEQIPPHGHRTTSTRIIRFNRAIIDATAQYAGFFKPNVAFYEAHGSDGLRALGETIEFAHTVAPEVPVILDAKRADIGNTNNGYVKMLNGLDADAITVNPYFGEKAMEPFLACKNKGIIVLARTSNPGAGEFQDLPIPLSTEQRLPQIEEWLGREIPERQIPFYLYVAFRVAAHWNKNGNCAVVAGATYPEQLGMVREMVRDMPILIPGIGKQGGDLAKAVRYGRNSHGKGFIINLSSGIIFASKGTDFAEAAAREAKMLHDSIIAVCAELAQEKG